MRACPEARVTMMPAAVETISAGTCATSPSPTVRIVYCDAACASGSPRWITAMKIPPRMLMPVMSSAAIASPFTNFEAPSIAP